MSKRILKKKIKVIDLLNQIVNLEYENQVKGAKRFEEIDFNKGNRDHPKIVKAVRMYWNENILFPGDASIKPIKVERSRLVEVDGRRCDHLGRPLKYYTLEDIN